MDTDKAIDRYRKVRAGYLQGVVSDEDYIEARTEYMDAKDITDRLEHPPYPTEGRSPFNDDAI